MMQLTLARARSRIRIGQEIGRGGEGAVYAIEDQRNYVAKIYSTPPDTRKIQKLAAMAEAASPALLKIAAWPIDVLVDSKGAVRGFMMPHLVARRDVHELYSPKSRAEAFPEADFRFLTHVATNIARAFAVVHDHGHVLGDVNHGNLLVGPDGTVILIDCDSFQIGTGANIYTCDVGVPLFTAPELHGSALRGLVRSVSHDQFGLAILLFHLLYMGRHPFAGRYCGPGDMPIEKAIAEYRFAYGPDRAAKGMQRPPGTIPLETMGAGVAQYFTRAFASLVSNGGRPDEKNWIIALEGLKSRLRSCATASWHQYPSELKGCPWCSVETQTGVRLFGQRITVVGPIGAIDIATLWQAIAAVQDPGPDPELPSDRPWTPPAGIDLPKNILKDVRRIFSMVLCFVGFVACSQLGKNAGEISALILYGLGIAVWPRVPAEKKVAANRVCSAVDAEWKAVLERWQREATQKSFSEKKMNLEKGKAELAGLPKERQRKMARLEADRESQQKKRYLDRFRIDRASISGIGRSRTTMLASFGIETAADVDRGNIQRIPGFGDVLTAALVSWRQEHERNFRFNPSAPVDRRDIDALDRDLEERRQKYLAVLRQGPDALRLQSREISAARMRLMPLMEKAWTSLRIAQIQRAAL